MGIHLFDNLITIYYVLGAGYTQPDEQDMILVISLAENTDILTPRLLISLDRMLNFLILLVSL